MPSCEDETKVMGAVPCSEPHVVGLNEQKLFLVSFISVLKIIMEFHLPPTPVLRIPLTPVAVTPGLWLLSHLRSARCASVLPERLPWGSPAL